MKRKVINSLLSYKKTAETRIAEKEVLANVEAIAVGKKRVDEAKALGVTPGKLNLV